MATPVIESIQVVQRDSSRSYLVDIGFSVYDPSGHDLTLVSMEYSTDNGGLWLPATAQVLDRRHTASSPLTPILTTAPGSSFNFVWNAFLDLPDGLHVVLIRLAVDDGITTTQDQSSPSTINASEIVDNSKTGLNRKLGRQSAISKTPLDFLGRGLINPFVRRSSDFAYAEGVELIRSSVRQILGTRAAVGGFSGEIPWRPDFGFKFWYVKHRQNNYVLRDIVLAYVQDALTQEPRVAVSDVDIEIDPENTMTVRVIYSIIDSNVDENRVELPFLEEVVSISG
jgi:phage baseplate assembly protein W